VGFCACEPVVRTGCATEGRCVSDVAANAGVTDAGAKGPRAFTSERGAEAAKGRGADPVLQSPAQQSTSRGQTTVTTGDAGQDLMLSDAGSAPCPGCTIRGDCVASGARNTCECNANAGFRNCGNGCVEAQCCSPADCSGRSCNGGTCAAAECTPGARRCSPNGVPELCGQSGLFSSQPACPDGQECQGGTCTASRVCFNNVTTNSNARFECAATTSEYCVPVAQANDFRARAQAACNACQNTSCFPASCGNEVGSGSGFTTSQGRVIWIAEGGSCPNLPVPVMPGDGFTAFDGIVMNFR
jgi:hypothetical protein